MMFGRASSRTIQKPEADPGIAIVLCEVLSKGPPEIRRLTVQLVGGNAQLVSKNHRFFMKLAGTFHLAGVFWPRGGSLLRVEPCGLSLSNQNGCLDRRELPFSRGCETKGEGPGPLNRNLVLLAVRRGRSSRRSDGTGRLRARRRMGC